MKKCALLIVSLFAVSCRTPDAQAPRAATPAPAAEAPMSPGPANLSFSCVQPKVGCDPAGFDMKVLGDLPQCSVMGPGALRLELKSSNDDHDGILIALEGYHGAGGYLLDDPSRKLINVSDAVTWNGCDGPTNLGKVLTAGDPSCASPACTVMITDETPDQPFPRPLTFRVRCSSLCENGGKATCQGPFDFMTRVTCS